MTIAGQELHGDDTDRSAAEAALWNVPDGGGIAAVEGCGAIRVPHRAAGRVASIALAGLAMVPGGDSAALAVGEGDDPLAA